MPCLWHMQASTTFGASDVAKRAPLRQIDFGLWVVPTHVRRIVTNRLEPATMCATYAYSTTTVAQTPQLLSCVVT